MQAEATSAFSPVPQSSAALRAAPIPWTDRRLGPENLKTLLLARLPAEPNGQDLLALFDRLKVRSVRQGDMRHDPGPRVRPRAVLSDTSILVDHKR